MKQSPRRHDDPAGSPALERICPEERLEWYRMTPQERWAASQRLWSTVVALGGQLEPDPDRQSPFDAPRTRGEGTADGRAGVHTIRRSGV
ncbi:MAG: hypothetical protein H0W36_14060 [Gemmatimonadetes bacterium]|nr:hypothetical protein [Gemmatimonadota bacterium]